MYEDGIKSWEARLDMYGKSSILEGNLYDCSFRYLRQYEDSETGLYYNRFRYYSHNLAFSEEAEVRNRGGIDALDNKISSMNDEKFKERGGDIDKQGNKIFKKCH